MVFYLFNKSSQNYLRFQAHSYLIDFMNFEILITFEILILVH